MVNTGKEQAFKKNALAALKEKFPDIQFFFFQRMLKTNKGECFEQAAFFEASEKGSILEKLVLFMPKNVKKTH